MALSSPLNRNYVTDLCTFTNDKKSLYFLKCSGTRIFFLEYSCSICWCPWKSRSLIVQIRIHSRWILSFLWYGKINISRFLIFIDEILRKNRITYFGEQAFSILLSPYIIRLFLYLVRGHEPFVYILKDIQMLRRFMSFLRFRALRGAASLQSSSLRGIFEFLQGEASLQSYYVMLIV